MEIKYYVNSKSMSQEKLRVSMLIQDLTVNALIKTKVKLGWQRLSNFKGPTINKIAFSGPEIGHAAGCLALNCRQHSNTFLSEFVHLESSDL